MKNSAFATFIRKRRALLGLTQQDIAERVGVTTSAVSRWESGETGSIRGSRIARLAEVLQTTTQVLVEQGIDGNAPSLEADMTPVSAVMKLVPRLGAIACGSPIFAAENLDGYEYVDKNMDADFALTAKGDSMVGARIHDGDVVFVKQADDVDDGDIAAVLVNGEATLKRIHRVDGAVVLSPANDDYKPIVVREGSDFQILGKAVAFQGKL